MDAPGGTWSRRSVLGGVASALALGSGCLDLELSPDRQSSDWPQRGYDAGHTNYKTTGSPPIEDVTVDWKAEKIAPYQIPDHSWVTKIAVGNGTVFTADGKAISLETGRVIGRSDCLNRNDPRSDLREGSIWFARTNSYTNGVIVSSRLYRSLEHVDASQSSPHGFNPAVLEGAGDGCGNVPRWTAGSPNDKGYSPVGAIDNGTVFAYRAPRDDRGSEQPSGRTVAIDADDGRVRWRTDDALDVDTFRADERSLFVKSDGYLGEPELLTVFERGTGHRQQQIELHEGGYLTAVRNGTAYLLSLRGLRAVNGRTGEIDWRADLAAISDLDIGSEVAVSVAVGPEAVFILVGTHSESVCISLDAEDGAVLWSQAVPRRSAWIAATDQSVYVSGNRVTCLDSANGDVRWDWTVPSDARAWGPLVVANRRLLVPAAADPYAESTQTNALYTLIEQ